MSVIDINKTELLFGSIINLPIVLRNIQRTKFFYHRQQAIVLAIEINKLDWDIGNQLYFAFK